MGIEPLDAGVVAVVTWLDGTILTLGYKMKLVFERCHHLHVSVSELVDHPLEEDPRTARPWLAVTSHEVGHDLGMAG